MADPDPSLVPAYECTYSPFTTTLQARITHLETQLDESDSKVRPPLWAQLLPFALPPHLATRHLTPSQLSHQPFPFSISQPDSLPTWSIFLLLSLLLLYHRVTRLSPFAKLVVSHEVAIAVAWILNAYSLTYACVQRHRKGAGRWPTRIQVWESEREKEAESARGESCSPVRGVLSFLGAVVGCYSFWGYLVLVVEKMRKREGRWRGKGHVIGGVGV